VKESEAQSLAERLQQRCAGEVLYTEFERAARATDFGGMYNIMPALVVRPSCVEDIQVALRFAAERGLTVNVRGMGHSQSAQGLGSGLTLDMTALNRITGLDAFGRSIEVEAGATWREVVEMSFEWALLPVALTYALDTTVGGTLSVGGIGSAAWSYGPQVDNVLYLDVITAEGELVRCSQEHERSLFDAVRAGLGQSGVIARVGFPLRPSGSHMLTRAFVYRDLNDLLRDAELLAAELDPQRFFAVRLGVDPLNPSSLMAVLCIGQAVEAAPSTLHDDLPALRHGFEAPARRDPTWTRDGVPGHPFFRVYGAPHLSPFGKRDKHPWVDLLFPLSAAPAALTKLASNVSGVLQHGTSEIIFIRRGPNPAPLLIVPHGTLIMGLGMFATFEAAEVERAATLMQAYAREMLACGGKRYLSGYFGPQESAEWAEHYGHDWTTFCAAKSRLDPTGRFESPLIKWPRGS
jgi:FAD/FMN-containing dehydrogenase